MRYELTDDEIVRFRELGAECRGVRARCGRKDSRAKTEIEIAAKWRRTRSAEYRVCRHTGSRRERITKDRQTVPTEDAGEKTLLLVTCAKRNGLIASLSRMVLRRRCAERSAR